MFRKRCFNIDRLVSHWVRDLKRSSVQEHLMNAKMGCEESVLLAIAVHTVVDDVVAELRQVLPDLMPATGSGVGLYNRESCCGVAICCKG